MTSNTNITDKNNVNLDDWFESTPEYNKLIELGVTGPVIDTIKGDLALYVDDNNLNDFNSIPEAELAVAIADNTDTKTRLRILWECKAAELDGYKDPIDPFDAPSYTESIDRDQAVDDNGKAIYDRYKLIVDTTLEDDPWYDWHNYSFSADDIEEFAKTW